MIDGGPGAEPPARLDAWLVTDERAELMAEIRRSAAARGLSPRAGSFLKRGLRIEARAVVHTNHRAYGYRIRAAGHTVVWAPEFYRFRAVGAPNRPHVRGGLRVGSSDPVCRRGRGPRRRADHRGGGPAPGCEAAGLRPHRPSDAASARARHHPAVREFATDGQVFVIRRKAFRRSPHGTEVASVYGRRTHRRGHAETESAEGKS
jgi:hypothetical protein